MRKYRFDQDNTVYDLRVNIRAKTEQEAIRSMENLLITQERYDKLVNFINLKIKECMLDQSIGGIINEKLLRERLENVGEFDNVVKLFNDKMLKEWNELMGVLK